MNLFLAWCQLNRVHPLPASVADVARFVGECSHLAPDVLWAELTAIDEQHEELLYSPPAKSRHVMEAFDRAHPVAPPRAWVKADWPLFASLPYGVKQIIVRREAERDRELQRCQNDAALWRKSKENSDAKAKTAA
jgi:hypothetical protein